MQGHFLAVEDAIFVHALGGDARVNFQADALGLFLFRPGVWRDGGGDHIVGVGVVF